MERCEQQESGSYFNNVSIIVFLLESVITGLETKTTHTPNSIASKNALQFLVNEIGKKRPGTFFSLCLESWKCHDAAPMTQKEHQHRQSPDPAKGALDIILNVVEKSYSRVVRNIELLWWDTNAAHRRNTKSNRENLNLLKVVIFNMNDIKKTYS